MIALILSRLADLRDARTLARTVRVQDEQIDTLTVLNQHLEAALEVAETAAEEYRARLEAMMAPRDAATLENRVLSVCESWRADRERDTAARLTAAEVELAAVRAEAASLRDDLRKADVALCSEREGRRKAEEGWSAIGSKARKIAEARERAEDRAARWERHARALARAARTSIRSIENYDGLPASTIVGCLKIGLSAIRRVDNATAPDDTRPEHDAPPPTQPSERRAAAPPSPPRFRAAAGGDR